MSRFKPTLAILPTLVILLLLKSCATIISGDAFSVSVEVTYAYMSKAGAVATAHCRSFNKQAILLRTEPISEDTTIAYFECR